MKKLFAISLLALSTVSAGAYANSNHSKTTPEQWFKKMDKNGDGMVSKDEAGKMSQAKFDKIDANHDGQISMDEKKAFHDTKKANKKTSMNKGTNDANAINPAAGQNGPASNNSSDQQ